MDYGSVQLIVTADFTLTGVQAKLSGPQSNPCLTSAVVVPWKWEP